MSVWIALTKADGAVGDNHKSEDQVQQDRLDVTAPRLSVEEVSRRDEDFVLF